MISSNSPYVAPLLCRLVIARVSQVTQEMSSCSAVIISFSQFLNNPQV